MQQLLLQPGSLQLNCQPASSAANAHVAAPLSADLLSQNRELQAFCRRHGIQFQAYSSLGGQYLMRSVRIACWDAAFLEVPPDAGCMRNGPACKCLAAYTHRTAARVTKH